jgi:hypothetical protein
VIQIGIDAVPRYVAARRGVDQRSRDPCLQRWLGEQPAGDVAISDWVTTEFSAALSIKRRTGQIRADDRDEAAAVFARLARDSFTVMPISRLHFQTAARFAERDSLALRAGDACTSQSAAITARPSVRSTNGSAMPPRCWA